MLPKLLNKNLENLKFKGKEKIGTFGTIMRGIEGFWRIGFDISAVCGMMTLTKC
jgi:hypothetical protein